MRHKLATFDFDGTLADSLPWFFRAIDQAAERYQFRRVEEAELEMLRGLETHQILLHLGLPVWKVPQIARFMRRRMGEEIASIRLFAGIDAALDQLSAVGIELAIVSSNSEENIRRVLGPRQAALIGHYECGVSLFGKRARLRRVLRASGVQPKEAIYIGDELRDLQAAHAEGINFGAVGWGYARLEALAAYSPEEIFSHVDQIPERLRGFHRRP